MKKITLLKWCDGCSTVCFTLFLAQWLAMSEIVDILGSLALFAAMCGIMIYGSICSLFFLKKDFEKKIYEAASDRSFLIRFFVCLLWFIGLPYDLGNSDLRFVFMLAVVVICTFTFVLFKKRETFSILSMITLCICTVVLLFKPYHKTEKGFELPHSMNWLTSANLGNKLNLLYLQRADLANLQFNKNEADEIIKNPFNISFAENVISQKTAEKKLPLQAMEEKRDSIATIFVHLKQQEYEQTIKLFSNKEENLKIKRLWLNSDILPWTYEAYTSFSIQYRHQYSLFGGSSIASLHVSGSADYQGDCELDYVNVILSDGTYLRYQIKDNPEWLLAKEGDSVLRKYKDKGFKLDDRIIRKLTCDMTDLCFAKEYVLQFKN